MSRAQDDGLAAARRLPTVLEGVLVAAIVGMATLIFQLNNSVTRLNTTVEQMAKQLDGLQLQLAGVPALAERVSRNEAKNDEQDRRIQHLEDSQGRTP